MTEAADFSARSRLLRAALDEVAESGLRGATTRHIAERARVNEVTLFRHFGSKSGLVAEALRHATEGFSVRRLPGRAETSSGT